MLEGYLSEQYTCHQYYLKTPVHLCLVKKMEDGDGYLGWGVDFLVGLIQMVQRHLGIFFKLNLLLDDEHASQESDETENAMRGQVGILEQSIAQKKSANQSPIVKQ